MKVFSSASSASSASTAHTVVSLSLERQFSLLVVLGVVGALLGSLEEADGFSMASIVRSRTVRVGKVQFGSEGVVGSSFLKLQAHAVSQLSSFANATEVSSSSRSSASGRSNATSGSPYLQEDLLEQFQEYQSSQSYKSYQSAVEASSSAAQPHSSRQQQQQQQVLLPQQEQRISSTSKSPTSPATARWLLVGAAALYGTNFAVVKLLNDFDGVGVGVSTSLRFFLAALVTGPWLLEGRTRVKDLATGETPTDIAQATRTGADVGAELMATSPNSSPATTTNKNDQQQHAAALAAGLEVGLYNSLGYVAQAVGLETVPAAESAFVCALAVVVVPILDWVSGRRLLQPKQAAGALAALVGVGLLVNVGELVHMDHASASGHVLSLVQPIAFGMGFWRMEQAMQEFPQYARASTAAQLWAVLGGSLVYALATDNGVTSLESVLHFVQDPWMVAALVWTGVVTTALTVYMETVALQAVSAAEATLIFSTEPLWGSVAAAVLLGESLGASSVAGAALILGGCLYANLGWSGLQQLLPMLPPPPSLPANNRSGRNKVD